MKMDEIDKLETISKVEGPKGLFLKLRDQYEPRPRDIGQKFILNLQIFVS